MLNTDTLLIIDALKELPTFGTDIEELPDFLYAHLSQCVLSAVFSLGSNATAERNVVTRYSNNVQLTPMFRERRDVLPPIQGQQPLKNLVDHIGFMGIDSFAKQIVQNQQRTSTINGILKINATYQFAKTLVDHEVQYLQDVDAIVGNPTFEQEILSIPGQQYGTSLYYFYMLTCREDYIKADRMVLRFLSRVLNRNVQKKEVLPLIRPVTEELRKTYPQITTRLIDNYIWINEKRLHHHS